VWAGIEDPDGELADCQARCDRLLEALGFPREKRRFSPHLTLGRVKDIAAGRQIRQALAREQASRIGAQTIDHLTFYQSTLGPAGPKYDVLSRHRFG